MTMRMEVPIQFVKTFDCSDTAPRQNWAGLHGELLFRNEIECLQIAEWPHAWQTLHIKNVRTKQDITLQPEPGQILELPYGMYEIRTSFDYALLSTWRIRLLAGTFGVVLKNSASQDDGQVYPLFRNKRINADATDTELWIPKTSGFPRITTNDTTAGIWEVSFHRYCASSGALQALGATLSTWPIGYEHAGSSPDADAMDTKIYVIAGIKYQVSVKNTGQENVIGFNMDVSTERH